MKKLRKILRVIVAVIILSILTATPVGAIANPDTQVEFGTGTVPLFSVFTNVLETGDWLIVAEVYTDYAATPTDYTATQAFLFELLDPTGTTTIISTSLTDYGDRPISIYLTPTEVATTFGLTSGTSYALRIDGNPLITFTAPPAAANRTRTRYLSPTDYIDQAGATDDNNPLRDFLILMANNIQTHDAPPAGSEYIVVIQGISYLTTNGGDIFQAGIPGLSAMCPVIFQSATEEMTSDAPDSTGAYASSLSANNTWGQVAARGLTNLGVYLGMSQAVAGMGMLLIFAIGLGGFIFAKTGSGALDKVKPPTIVGDATVLSYVVISS